MVGARNLDQELNTPVTTGSNLLSIAASDARGNATSNHIQLTVSGTTAQTLPYDLNGNLLGDGANTYEWDAANRLVAINEPGSRRSEFTYNGLSQRVKIVEKTNGSVTSTKQLVWCPGEAQPCEERDASNNVTKRYYPQGMRVGSTNYFYTRDHLGSIRELTNGSGAVQTRYDYDPYGRRTRLTGTLDADFGFTGHYYHSPSGLHLALYRAYNADLGRWISRDPIEEAGGINLYAYVGNSPTNRIDPTGLVFLMGGLSDSGNAAYNEAMNGDDSGGGGSGSKSCTDSNGYTVSKPGWGPDISGENIARWAEQLALAGVNIAAMFTGLGEADLAMTEGQVALKELVEEATLGGRQALNSADTTTVIEWAQEVNYPGFRASPGDLATPSNWTANPVSHIHLPGVGSGHIPVTP